MHSFGATLIILISLYLKVATSKGKLLQKSIPSLVYADDTHGWFITQFELSKGMRNH